MKIRNGFVSNSSSSSYIVKIKNLDFEELANCMASEYSYDDFFSLEQVKEKLDETIKSLSDGEHSEWYKHHLEQLNELKVELDAINPEDSFEKILRVMLKYYQIGVKETNNAVELSCFTSMHNSFNEGMSDVLKEIMLYFLFDRDYEVKCHRDSDN